MLMPKRVKRRKQFRGSMRGKALRGNKITYGEYGIVATEPAWIKSNQIEAARVAMTRYIKRGGKVWIKIFPDKPVTKTPAETRMGKGKGALEYWVAVVKPGRVMFEIAGVPEEVAREALRLATHKLPVKCKIVFGNRFVDVHFLPVSEGDDESILELWRNGAFRTQHFVIITGSAIRIFVYALFLIIIHIFQPFQPLVVFGKRFGRGEYLYLKRNFTVIGCAFRCNRAVCCRFCCRSRFCPGFCQ